MVISTTGYTNIYTHPKTAQTYIDKYDKSLKLPFISVLHNSTLNTKPALDDEVKIVRDDKRVVLKQSADIDSAAYIIESTTGSDFTQSSMKR